MFFPQKIVVLAGVIFLRALTAKASPVAHCQDEVELPQTAPKTEQVVVYANPEKTNGTVDASGILVPVYGVSCSQLPYSNLDIMKALAAAQQCGGNCDCTNWNGWNGPKTYPSFFNNNEGWFPVARGQLREFPLLSGQAYCSGNPWAARIIFDTYDFSFVGAVYHTENNAFSCCKNNHMGGSQCSCNLAWPGYCP